MRGLSRDLPPRSPNTRPCHAALAPWFQDPRLPPTTSRGLDSKGRSGPWTLPGVRRFRPWKCRLRPALKSSCCHRSQKFSFTSGCARRFAPGAFLGWNPGIASGPPGRRKAGPGRPPPARARSGAAGGGAGSKLIGRALHSRSKRWQLLCSVRRQGVNVLASRAPKTFLC